MESLFLSKNVFCVTGKLIAWDISSRVWGLKIERDGRPLNFKVQMPRIVMVARKKRDRIISIHVASVMSRNGLSEDTKLYSAPLMDVSVDGELHIEDLLPLKFNTHDAGESVIRRIEEHSFAAFLNEKSLRRKPGASSEKVVYWRHLDYLSFLRKSQDPDGVSRIPGWSLVQRPETLGEFLAYCQSR